MEFDLAGESVRIYKISYVHVGFMRTCDWTGGRTNGMWIKSCSSESLSSSGFSSSRSAHVFFTIAFPEPDSASFIQVISSKFMCWYKEYWRAGVMSSEWSWPARS